MLKALSIFSLAMMVCIMTGCEPFDFTDPSYLESCGGAGCVDSGPGPEGFDSAVVDVDIEGADNDVYFDFSSGTITEVAHGASFSGDWDIFFTAIDVPVGITTFTLMDTVANDGENVLFYYFEQPLDYMLEVDTSELNGPGFAGYPLPEGAPASIAEAIQAPYPSIGSTWNSGFPSYDPLPITIVVQTAEGNYGKYQITTYDSDNFVAEFLYSYLTDGTTFPE